jgi:HTH-type transcriptional regulator/antitoxin HigA
MRKLSHTIIKNDKQYNDYCDQLERLTEKYTIENEDEIELLSFLIHKYNDEQTEKHLVNLNPIELLLDLLSENNISQKELALRIGISPQLVNDIIKYRREITKHIALKLGAEFKLNFYAFLKPYKLKRAS